VRHGGGVGVVVESTGYRSRLGSKWLTRTMGDGQGPSVLLASSVDGGVDREEWWAREREEEVEVESGGSRQLVSQL
jgi:hypothetical protein